MRYASSVCARTHGPPGTVVVRRRSPSPPTPPRSFLSPYRIEDPSLVLGRLAGVSRALYLAGRGGRVGGDGVVVVSVVVVDMKTKMKIKTKTTMANGECDGTLAALLLLLLLPLLLSPPLTMILLL